MTAPALTASDRRVEILFRFAAGGMAEIFLGRFVGESGSAVPLAVKVISPAHADDPRIVSMFFDEARIAAQIASAHVVPVIDHGHRDDGTPFLVMPLVVGRSLAQLVREATARQVVAPLSIIARIVADAADGLHDAHGSRGHAGEALGIIHRDVSPQNVLVDIRGVTRVTDFGIAHAIQRETTTRPEWKGKWGYMSPEQWRMEELDARSDVFALGVVAWEAFAQRRLFPGTNPLGILDALTQRPIPPLTSVRSDVPRELSDVIAHALAREREERFRSAAEFAEAIRRSAPIAATSAVSAFVLHIGGQDLLAFRARVAEALHNPPTTLPSSGIRSVYPAVQIDVRDDFVVDSVVTSPAPSAESAHRIADSATTAGKRHDTGTSSAAPTPGGRQRLPALVVALLALGLVAFAAATSSREGTARERARITPASGTRRTIRTEDSGATPAGAGDAGVPVTAVPADETDAAVSSVRVAEPDARTTSRRAAHPHRPQRIDWPDGGSSPDAHGFDDGRSPDGAATLDERLRVMIVAGDSRGVIELLGHGRARTPAHLRMLFNAQRERGQHADACETARRVMELGTLSPAQFAAYQQYVIAQCQ